MHAVTHRTLQATSKYLSHAIANISFTSTSLWSDCYVTFTFNIRSEKANLGGKKSESHGGKDPKKMWKGKWSKIKCVGSWVKSTKNFG